MMKLNPTMEDVMQAASLYLSKPESIDLINRAYEFAKIKHEGQFRKSGEPYIVHLIAVAHLLATMQTGPSTIAAGLLHDTVEDCSVTLEEISKSFSPDIAKLVESVTKIGRLADKDEADFQAENHRKIFIAMAKDIRVILIKLADRLHNMRTIQYQRPERQLKIAKETSEVYAPIAHRLGINTIKSELEDLSLKVMEPEKYHQVEFLVSKKQSEREDAVKQMYLSLSNLLQKEKIPFRLSGRIKNNFSIYKKMYVKGYQFEEIFDLQALRVITETETQCYEVLGHIHANFRPIPGRFKDYIAMPKPNLYQSLHTSIIGDNGNIFEIQIRTEKMDEIAEGGVAAHWRYKENIVYDQALEQKQIEEKLHWFRELVSINEEDDKESEGAREYMNTLQKDIFEANVYVMSPMGKVVDLPAGATPIDFAYKIHTKVGDSTIGATVNGILVPLSTQLKTGDIVDIRTSKSNTMPSEGWLKFVKTASAKNHIRKSLQKKNLELRREELIQDGIQLLETAIKAEKWNVKETIKQINEEKFLSTISFHDIDDLYIGLANKTTNANSILNRIRDENKKRDFSIESFNKKRENLSSKNHPSKNGLIVKGIDSIAVSLSNCCSPIPGDNIVGYISQGKGIKVHREDCPNIANVGARLIEVGWDYQSVGESVHAVSIQIMASDRPQLLLDVMNVLGQQKISLSQINANMQTQTLTVIINAKILVKDAQRLLEVFAALRSGVAGIYDITRVTKN